MYGKWKGSYAGKWWGLSLISTIVESVQRYSKFVVKTILSINKVPAIRDKFVVKKPAKHG